MKHLIDPLVIATVFKESEDSHDDVVNQANHAEFKLVMGQLGLPYVELVGEDGLYLAVRPNLPIDEQASNFMAEFPTMVEAYLVNNDRSVSLIDWRRKVKAVGKLSGSRLLVAYAISFYDLDGQSYFNIVETGLSKTCCGNGCCNEGSE